MVIAEPSAIVVSESDRFRLTLRRGRRRAIPMAVTGGIGRVLALELRHRMSLSSRSRRA